jgi:proteic killer suppression protein
MEVKFSTSDLKRLAEDASFDGEFPREVVVKYLMRLQTITAALDERAFYAMKSLHFEKLKGKRSHQRSMRLDNSWRLIVEIEKGKPKNAICIMAIENHYE